MSALRDPQTWSEAAKRAVVNVTLQVVVARTVIGKKADLSKPGNLNDGDTVIGWQSTGNPRTNWLQNSSLLRKAMREGKPIRDVSVNPVTGELRNNTGFLRAERELLRDHGWQYSTDTGCWHPPGG